MLLSFTDFLAFKQMFLDYKEVCITTHKHATNTCIVLILQDKEGEGVDLGCLVVVTQLDSQR